jgi:hypothetical protein
MERGKSDLDHRVAEPCNEAVLVEIASHCNQGCKPDERVPGGALREALLPGDHPRGQQSCQPNDGRSHGVDLDGTAKDPQHHLDTVRGAPTVRHCIDTQ